MFTYVARFLQSDIFVLARTRAQTSRPIQQIGFRNETEESDSLRILRERYPYFFSPKVFLSVYYSEIVSQIGKTVLSVKSHIVKNFVYCRAA